MKFDYQTYQRLLYLLKDNSYTVTGYDNYQDFERTVILRHDIDFDIQKAVCMAKMEEKLGFFSTYFVLLRSDFYNAFSYKSIELLNDITRTGCRIGLHFDETCYPKAIGNPELVIQHILNEKEILSNILNSEINLVSMHMPSKRIIESELVIPGMINTYRSEFFKQMKYISDSCRQWREPVEDIICNQQYERLHLLTHSFWWNEHDIDISTALRGFVNSANKQRYDELIAQVHDYSLLVKPDEVS